MLARLVAVEGPLQGRIFALDAEELAIGRQPSSGLCLDDDRVSRRHCAIHFEQDSFYLVDLDTRNGGSSASVPKTDAVWVASRESRGSKSTSA